MEYDPTKSALLFPERQPALGPGLPWNDDAILAECARLAYFRFESDAAAGGVLRTALARFGYGDFASFSAPGSEPEFDAQAYATSSPAKGALIAVRGTQGDSFKDVAADAKFKPSEWRGLGKVHAGFWESIAEILPAIESWLAAVRPTRLVVTGHSLGAAHATLLAALRPEAALVTFGSPRVGNEVFVAAFAGRSVRRYVDCLDIVARVPPLLYSHVPGLRAIDHRGVVQPGGLDDPLADRVAAAAAYIPHALDPRNCVIRDLADHAPINYVSALLGIRTGP